MHCYLLINIHYWVKKLFWIINFWTLFASWMAQEPIVQMSRFSPAQLSAAIKVRAACITGDLDTLKEMVKQDHTIVQTPYEYGKTPLSIAASWGHDELIQFEHTIFNWCCKTIYSLLRYYYWLFFAHCCSSGFWLMKALI